MFQNTDISLDSTQDQEKFSLILVVDDDVIIQHTLREMLRRRGYQVITASNGMQALEAYRQCQPDLVILDAVMPVMDGFTCCQQLSELASDLPILMLTSLDDTESVDRAFAAGATDYLTKPIHWAVLGHRIQRLLQLRQATAELKQRSQQEQLMRKLSELSADIAQRMRQSLELDEILNTVVTEVRQFLQTDRALIYRCDPKSTGTLVAESAAKGYFCEVNSELPDNSLGNMYLSLHQHGRIRVVEDIYTTNFHPWHLDFLVQLKVRASLVIPMMQADQLWGLLIVHHCAAPRQWQSLEIDLLDRLIAQLMVAIQQAELHQQVQQLNATLEQQVEERTGQLQQALKFESTLKRITDQVRDSLDEEQILQTAVQGLALSLGVQICDTALYDLNQRTSTICFEYVMPGIVPYQGVVASFDQLPAVYHTLLQGNCLQFCLLPPEPGSSRDFENDFAILACPMRDDQGVVGDLWLFKPQTEAFNDLELRLVQQVANQCAIAIRQTRLYQAAQKQVTELEILHQSKDEFLSTVSHELRSPISNIRMAATMLSCLLPKTWQDNPEIAQNPAQIKSLKYLKILYTECEREINLIDDLLDLQRLGANSQPLILDVIDLQMWIWDVIEPFQIRAQERQQVFHLHLDSHLPPVYSDPTSLKRILAELLNNACNYTPPGEKITVSITGALARSFQICVSNSGVEIPAAELRQIFDKFYRIPCNASWKQGGTGLGLALVQQLAQYLNGVVWVESQPGQTRFIVELPVGTPSLPLPAKPLVNACTNNAVATVF